MLHYFWRLKTSMGLFFYLDLIHSQGFLPHGYDLLWLVSMPSLI